MDAVAPSAARVADERYDFTKDDAGDVMASGSGREAGAGTAGGFPREAGRRSWRSSTLWKVGSL
jgi:hypothetical protein